MSVHLLQSGGLPHASQASYSKIQPSSALAIFGILVPPPLQPILLACGTTTNPPHSKVSKGIHCQVLLPEFKAQDLPVEREATPARCLLTWHVYAHTKPMNFSNIYIYILNIFKIYQTQKNYELFKTIQLVSGRLRLKFTSLTLRVRSLPLYNAICT